MTESLDLWQPKINKIQQPQGVIDLLFIFFNHTATHQVKISPSLHIYTLFHRVDSKSFQYDAYLKD